MSIEVIMSIVNTFLIILGLIATISCTPFYQYWKQDYNHKRDIKRMKKKEKEFLLKQKDIDNLKSL